MTPWHERRYGRAARGSAPARARAPAGQDRRPGPAPAPRSFNSEAYRHRPQPHAAMAEERRRARSRVNCCRSCRRMKSPFNGGLPPLAIIPWSPTRRGSAALAPPSSRPGAWPIFRLPRLPRMVGRPAFPPPVCGETDHLLGATGLPVVLARSFLDGFDLRAGRRSPEAE